MDLRSEFRGDKEAKEPADNGGGQTVPDTANDIERYPTAGNSRVLFLVDQKGAETFFYYSDLLSGTYSPDETMITLTFRNAVVKLKGKNLSELYNEIGYQLPRKINAVENRYKIAREDFKAYITEVIITLNS